MQGIITPIVTPFYRDDDQSINEQEAKRLIDYLLEHGVNGIFILGSNGEFHVLDEREKIRFANVVINHVNKRVPVYVGTGCCSTRETIRLSKQMETLGADALSIITPYFLKPTEEDLFQHYQEIDANVTIPIVLYNIPKACGYSLPPTLVERLAKLKNIKAIKDSSGDEATIKAYAAIAKTTGLRLLIGSDSKISFGYGLGASGAVAGTSNVIAKTLVELDQALRTQDKTTAHRLQADIDVIRSVLGLGTVPSVMKRAVELANIATVGPARKPVQALNEESDCKILEALAYYKASDS